MSPPVDYAKGSHAFKKMTLWLSEKTFIPVYMQQVTIKGTSYYRIRSTVIITTTNPQ